MADRVFRFGVVAPPTAGGAQWQAAARQAESLGYDTLLVPDNLRFPAPTVSLAIAAAVTTGLRVGTYVMAIPLRTPRAAAWDAHSLTALTDGRFEFGVGTGLPAMRDAAAELGLPYGNAGERLAQVASAIAHLRRLDGAARTPVMVAAGGPKSTALAVDAADILALSQFSGPRAGALRAAEHLRAEFGSRLDHLELAANIFVVGSEVPAWMEQFVGADSATMVATDMLTMLRGTSPTEMADELQRRREQLGVSYVTVNQAFMTQFAPVAQLLAGR